MLEHSQQRYIRKKLLQDGNRNWLKPIADEAFKDEHQDISSMVFEVRPCVYFCTFIFRVEILSSAIGKE